MLRVIPLPRSTTSGSADDEGDQDHGNREAHFPENNPGFARVTFPNTGPFESHTHQTAGCTTRTNGVTPTIEGPCPLHGGVPFTDTRSSGLDEPAKITSAWGSAPGRPVLASDPGPHQFDHEICSRMRW